VYKLALKRDFVAQHYLLGADCVDETRLHSHHYTVEIQLEGEKLNLHGYMVDIVDLTKCLDETITHFKDKTLNQLPQFKEINPSIEHFARIFCESVSEAINFPNIEAITIIIGEDDIAWASYQKELK
jgi:6-pyruvoyltetrahydropterin/6-carboxytetrahydropterin synthase